MSEHNHNDCCGCGHNHMHDYITLSLDDGTELQCIVLDIFTVDDKDYIALQPIEGRKTVMYFCIALSKKMKMMNPIC